MGPPSRYSWVIRSHAGAPVLVKEGWRGGRIAPPAAVHEDDTSKEAEELGLFVGCGLIGGYLDSGVAVHA